MCLIFSRLRRLMKNIVMMISEALLLAISSKFSFEALGLRIYSIFSSQISWPFILMRIIFQAGHLFEGRGQSLLVILGGKKTSLFKKFECCQVKNKRHGAFFVCLCCFRIILCGQQKSRKQKFCCFISV